MGIRQTLKNWAAYQQTVRELAALDNRQLSDQCETEHHEPRGWRHPQHGYSLPMTSPRKP